MTTCSPTSIAPSLVSTAATDSSSRETNLVTSTPSSTEIPSARHSSRRPRPTDVEREPALALVQADGDALRAPVGEGPFMCSSTSDSPLINSER